MKAGVGRLGYRGAAWLAIAAWLCMACGGADDAAPEPSETARPGGTAATGTTRLTTATPVTSTSTTAAPSPTPGEPAAATTTPAATTAGAANTPAPTSTAAAPTPTPPVPTATPPPRPSTVSIVIHAQSLAFDVAVVRVPAGARVTATLQNDDPGVEHNLTFGVPGLPHGPTCSGPCTRTQTFTAPAAGSYYYLCTLHDMFGDLIVEP